MTNNNAGEPKEAQRTVVIESRDYADTVTELRKDPIIMKMAATLPRNVDTSEWSFVSLASRHYHEQGGTIQTHIGGPAEAIRQLLGR